MNNVNIFLELIENLDGVCHTRHRGGLKNLLDFWKERISGILFFNGDILCLRSRHLVLWSLGTLTGQQRFYGTRLVTQKGRHYHPLSVLPKAGCIADFVINC
jgi:hypothetical protein